jgi:hypothetical protein
MTNNTRKHNKKAEIGAEDWLERIPEIILTVVVLAGILILVSYFVNISVNIKPLQPELLLNRMLYSPGGITYQDNETGIVYPGVIDYEKFTNQTLDGMMKYSYDRMLSAKLELYNSRKELEKTAFFNSIWFNRIEPLASNKISGAESGVITEIYMPIVYRKNIVDFPGYLRIQVLVSN